MSFGYLIADITSFAFGESTHDEADSVHFSPVDGAPCYMCTMKYKTYLPGEKGPGAAGELRAD